MFIHQALGSANHKGESELAELAELAGGATERIFNGL